MKKHLDKILIIIGIIIIGTAVGMKMQADYREKQLIEEYKNRMASLNDEMTETDNSNDDSAAEKSNTENSEAEEYHENIIGIIEIPKIELTAPIGQGVDNQTLKYSVGHFEQTAMPDEKGNCCLIGHRSYTYGQYFNRLDEIEKGDTITVQYKNNTYNYIVSDTFVVEPQEVSVLESQKDGISEITLITCTPLRVGTHRLIIKGILQ
ncbi:class D sortase [uncultured Clostridium sp.]|uniref:class D sortase n=1 Tax=uncultured Clostridium sp. TaxID=59620 RepID=UPI0025FBABA7|nr:class D sortase [uncultured Clostridium sp.]